MSEHHPVHDGHADRGFAPGEGESDAWLGSGLLQPGACALVAIVLAVLVLMGNNLMVLGAEAIFGNLLSHSGDVGHYLVSTGMGMLVPTALSLFLSRRALTAGTASPQEAMVARAAVMLAVVAAVYAVVTLVGGALSIAGNYESYTF